MPGYPRDARTFIQYICPFISYQTNTTYAIWEKYYLVGAAQKI